MENRQRVAFAGERREGRKNDVVQRLRPLTAAEQDRKSTRLNSSHCNLVCRLLLEKKKKQFGNVLHANERVSRLSDARARWLRQGDRLAFDSTAPAPNIPLHA